MPKPLPFCIRCKKDYAQILREAKTAVAKWPKQKHEAMNKEVLNINSGKRNETTT